MYIYYNKFVIRNALESDAPTLCRWWNDGAIMAHAGFPNGLGETIENITNSLKKDNDATSRRHVIEYSGNPIGEMSYSRVKEEKADINAPTVAEIGIKICDTNLQNKGYGTLLLMVFTDALFRYYGFTKVTLDTNLNNTRAQHVYEDKLRFKRIKVNQNAWQDQLGEWQSTVDYEITKDEWINQEKELPSYIHIRNETPDDYHTVESITRDAFWDNAYHFCDEHLLVHNLRKSEGFIPELDFVAEIEGKVVGHIIYTKSFVEDDSGIKHEMLTFGPLTVVPKYHFMGIGTALLNHSIREATRLGYIAIVIYGHPDYYPRFGFRRAKEFSITTNDGKNFDAFMALPLYEGSLDFVKGKLSLDNAYWDLSEEDSREYDKNFEEKERYIPILIDVLLERLNPAAAESIKQAGLKYLTDMKAKSQNDISNLDGIDDAAIDTIKKVMLEHHYRWGI